MRDLDNVQLTESINIIDDFVLRSTSTSLLLLLLDFTFVFILNI